jgi:hypothetical protein
MTVVCTCAYIPELRVTPVASHCDLGASNEWKELQKSSRFEATGIKPWILVWTTVRRYYVP